MSRRSGTGYQKRSPATKTSARSANRISIKKRRCAQAALRKETPGGADPLADDLGLPQMPTEGLVERVRAGFPIPELELLVQLEADDLQRRHWRYIAVEAAQQATWAGLPPDYAAWPTPASTRALWGAPDRGVRLGRSVRPECGDAG